MRNTTTELATKESVASTRGPSVRVTLERNLEGPAPQQLRFTPASGAPFKIDYWLNPAQAREQNLKLARDLLTFRAMVGNQLTSSIEDAATALAVLHRRGISMLSNIFGDTSEIEAVSELFRRACLSWRHWGSDLDAPQPSLVEVEAPLGQIVPIELLPLFDLGVNTFDGTLASLQRAASAFIGFSTIVRRIIPNVVHVKETTLDATPKLPMKLFRYAGLSGAEIERAFLQDLNSAVIDCDGPWPLKSGPKASFLNELTHAVMDPSSRWNRAAMNTSAQIYHFACHCDTTSADSTEHTITLSGTGWDPSRTATWDELDGEFRSFDIAMGPSRPKRRPLVFLNACGSSDVSPAGLGSFPHLFLKYRHLGFIGTETKIPDHFAAAFSTQFYDEMLKARSLGDAIHATRWTLLAKNANPLGILYTVYADPDICLSRS